MIKDILQNCVRLLAITGASTFGAAPQAGAWQEVERGSEGWTLTGLINGDYDELDIRGRLQADIAHIGGGDKLGVSGFGTNAEFRRARIGIQGELNFFEYRFEGEFAGSDAQISDAYISIALSDMADLTVGHQKNVISLSEETSSRFIKFMERAAFTDAYAFSRGVGATVDFSGKNWGASVGLLSGRPLSATDTFDGYALAARYWYQLALENGFLQFGASGELRDGGAQLTRVRQRPQIHATSNRLINTADAKLPDGREVGRFPADQSVFLGGEFGGRFGPLDFAAEYGRLSIDFDSPLLPGAANSFAANGFYIQAGYFLTGEERGWRGGKWRRTRPNRPLGSGGTGAWQINAGIDRLDLNDSDAGVFGGRQTAYLMGLDWIPTDDPLRFTLNYGHVEIKDSPGFAPGSGANDFSINWIGFRAQVDW